MECSQLHHINLGFYTTLLYSVYPHLVPTSVHPCLILPYISYNYIHRSLFTRLRNWPTSAVGVVFSLTLIKALVIRPQLVYSAVQGQTQICLSPSWSAEMPRPPKRPAVFAWFLPFRCSVRMLLSGTLFPAHPAGGDLSFLWISIERPTCDIYRVLYSFFFPLELYLFV